MARKIFVSYKHTDDSHALSAIAEICALISCSRYCEIICSISRNRHSMIVQTIRVPIPFTLDILLTSIQSNGVIL